MANVKVYGDFHCTVCQRPIPYVYVPKGVTLDDASYEVVCFRCRAERNVATLMRLAAPPAAATGERAGEE